MSPYKSHTLITRNRFLARKTWIYFSKLGTGYSDKLVKMRSNVLSNQINFILSITMLCILVITITTSILTHDTIGFGTLRVGIMLAVSLVNLALAHYGYQQISKYSLIFLTPVIFLIWPVLIGFVEEEGYTYNNYFLIAASIIPQLLLSSEKEKFVYWFSMTYYFLLVACTDLLMFHFQTVEFPIVDRIRGFYPFYKLGHIGIFFFINICIYHLRKVNFRFEDRLNVKNQVLNIQNKKLKVQQEKIIQQKNIIEQNSRAISDSINYAASIQQAVLQPIDFLDEWKIKNFILYKPKAVVSGDFYWGIKRDKREIIVAADCTGHGVPGAFMCMLGLAFLDDIFKSGDVSNAAGILDILRENVANKLKQNGGSCVMRDGMDISVCIINRDAGTLEFAGANNPIYLIRDSKLSKLAADKMPIGMYSPSPSPYTNTVIGIKPDDRLYMFSDGYADQFGGKNGKKLMYRQFQELLVRNHYKPMDLQKVILENNFEKWKGEHDQVDDVLIIGLQI
jgi:serine phosphatase RsbU (regulator of sigma subunit)